MRCSCRWCSTGAAEGGEGVRWGTGETVRRHVFLCWQDWSRLKVAIKSWCLRLTPSDQLPEQCDCGPAAEKRRAEDQAEEARSGRVQRQRRDGRVKNTRLIFQARCQRFSVYSFLSLHVIENWITLFVSENKPLSQASKYACKLLLVELNLVSIWKLPVN